MKKRNKDAEFKSLFEYYGFTKSDEREYPVISGILKKLTPERIEEEIKTVKQTKLPRELEGWVEEYENFGKRSLFFWQFMFRGQRMFSFIKKGQKHKTIELKFLITILIILFDDIADQKRDPRLLSNMLKIIINNGENISYKNLSSKEINYLKFTLKIWGAINKKIKKLPRFIELEEVFKYDIYQTINAMKYAYLINKKPFLINKTEYWLYVPHTLQGMINCTLDLMCLTKKHLKEAGVIREIFWNSQRMGRISNCLSTWKNEFKKEDLTSAVLVYAINYKLIKFSDLYKKNKNEIIELIEGSTIRNKLFEEWENCYGDVYSLCNKTKLIRADMLLKQLSKFFVIYLSAEKLYDHRYNT